MATHRIPILNGYFKPDTSGTVYFEPMGTNFGSNDRYNHLILALTSQSAKQGGAGKFTVPKNYVGTASIVVEWATTATTGDIVFDFDYTAIGGDGTESFDPSTDQESVTVTDSASATARRRMECSMNLTSSNLVADDAVVFNFSRDAAAAGDTLAATGWAFGLFFQYSDA